MADEVKKAEEQKPVETKKLPVDERFRWRCLDCTKEAPGTNAGYMSMLRHGKGHKYHLVDVTTGEKAATTIKNAVVKGIVLPKNEKAASPPQKSEERPQTDVSTAEKEERTEKPEEAEEDGKFRRQEGCRARCRGRGTRNQSAQGANNGDGREGYQL